MKASTINKPQGVGSSGTKPFLKEPIPVKRAKVDKFILAQVAFCTFPALILVRFGFLKIGSIWCFVFLLTFLALYGLKRNIPAFVALTVAAMPALSYTRGFFFYNSVVALLGLGLGFWYLRSPKEFSRLWNNKSIKCFFIAGTVYWVVSVLLTRQYYSNIRVMEMLFSAGCIYLLTRHTKYLASALTGLGISLVSIAIGMIGKGDRLGMADIEGQHLGNAITFGLPVALALLLAIVDSGKWLFLHNSSIVKYVWIALCGVFLMLSTSRGAWMVALVGIVVTIFFQSQQRRKIFVALLLAGCVLVGVLQTQSGEKVSHWFEKLTDSEKTLSQKTTGRLEMWQLLPSVLKDYPIWGVGPGRGKEAYAHYSWIDREVTFHQGEELAWHAMYLQVGVETGWIGIIVLTVLLATLIFSALSYRRLTGNVLPLIGIIFFITAGLSVPAFDGISGISLGLAFLASMPAQRQIANL